MPIHYHEFDIIDRIDMAKYIATVDLTKGYWQVPVTTTRRHKHLLHNYISIQCRAVLL